MRRTTTTRKNMTASIVCTAAQPKKRSTAETSMRRALEPQKKSKTGVITRRATLPERKSNGNHSQAFKKPSEAQDEALRSFTL